MAVIGCNEAVAGVRSRSAADGVWIGRAGGNYNSGLLLPLCLIQNGCWLAKTFRRRSVSSSGGFSLLSSFFERGCLTILAVGKAVNGEASVGAAAVMTLGFM